MNLPGQKTCDVDYARLGNASFDLVRPSRITQHERSCRPACLSTYARGASVLVHFVRTPTVHHWRSIYSTDPQFSSVGAVKKVILTTTDTVEPAVILLAPEAAGKSVADRGACRSTAPGIRRRRHRLRHRPLLRPPPKISRRRHRLRHLPLHRLPPGPTTTSDASKTKKIASSPSAMCQRRK